MTSPYQDFNDWQGWDYPGSTLDNQILPGDGNFSIDYDLFADCSPYQPVFLSGSLQPDYIDSSHGLSPAIANITSYSQAWEQQSASSISSSATEPCIDGRRLLQCFAGLPQRSEPMDTYDLQRQTPRFDGDLYTATFIRGEGVGREGWCGFCSSWHKLKDSAYWYHLHYTHGVSCATGRQLIGPQKIQWNLQFNGWQGLCARCHTWLTLGKGDRAAKTAYYRHAYQCHVKSNPRLERSTTAKKSRSPRVLFNKSDNSPFPEGPAYV